MNNNIVVNNYDINLKKFQNIYNVKVNDYNINLKKNFNTVIINYLYINLDIIFIFKLF